MFSSLCKLFGERKERNRPRVIVYVHPIFSLNLYLNNHMNRFRCLLKTLFLYEREKINYYYYDDVLEDSLTGVSFN